MRHLSTQTIELVMNPRVFALLLCLLAFVSDAAAEFRAGIAFRIVTPDPLLPVSGGVGPSHKVTRKEGELNVRALVLQQDDTRVAIVSADFLGFPSITGVRPWMAVLLIAREFLITGIRGLAGYPSQSVGTVPVSAGEQYRHAAEPVRDGHGLTA